MRSRASMVREHTIRPQLAGTMFFAEESYVTALRCFVQTSCAPKTVAAIHDCLHRSDAGFGRGLRMRMRRVRGRDALATADGRRCNGVDRVRLHEPVHKLERNDAGLRILQ